MLAKVATNRATDDGTCGIDKSSMQQKTRLEAFADTGAPSRSSSSSVPQPSWHMEMQVLLDILIGQDTVSKLLTKYSLQPNQTMRKMSC